MIWLKPSEYEKQEYMELRLYASEKEKILLNEFILRENMPILYH